MHKEFQIQSTYFVGWPLLPYFEQPKLSSKHIFLSDKEKQITIVAANVS